MIRIDARRRQVLGALAGLAAARRAAAQTPHAAGAGRLVRILVGFPAGQATDTIARLWAERLGAEPARDTYIVDNRPGQGGSIALAQLARAPADGSQMMLAHMSALATNPHLYRSVGYDTPKDFESAGLIADVPFVLAVNPSVPARTMAELVRHARAHPGTLTNASSGNGTVSHLAMEEIKRVAAMQITHVPYRGSSLGLTDVIAGNVSMALETAAAVMPHVEAGRLRALAAGSAERLAALPDLPTLSEQGFPGVTAVTWLMAVYPTGVGQAVLDATHAAIARSMRVPEVEQRLVAIGTVPRYSASPAEATAYMRDEFTRWGAIVRRSGVALD